ncbi:MAG: lipopolysaccharide heptosyltransferase II [Xanthobacteraceae bacterium]|nr:MAG: lipopolysaccharide heptosyltransferase II [Xanthobacteraceae bacterium]
MNSHSSLHLEPVQPPQAGPAMPAEARVETRPILIVPYMWIGDFVRCHTVVRVLKERWPHRPVDLLSTTLCAPLVDYMPGVRKAIIWDLPRKRIAFARHLGLARLIEAEGYGSALIMPRTWKSALAPSLAGIPERTGFIGEARFGLINDWRRGEKALPRMVDRCAMLALPPGATLPARWPEPQLVVGPDEVAAWRRANKVSDAPAVVMAPGAVGPSKRWSYFAEAARTLATAGIDVWVVGGPGEKDAATAIVAMGGARVRDMTGTDLRQAIVAMAAANVAVSNDSGLLHVAAALGTPSIGIFGPTSPYHWAPLNPLAAIIETRTEVACRPCHKPVCRVEHHRCMRDIAIDDVVAATRQALAQTGAAAP